MSKDYFKSGSWNALCGVCGFKYKADQLKQRWDGVWVCNKDWEPRNILDFFKVRPDSVDVPWAQSEQTDTSGYANITVTDSPYTAVYTTRIINIDAVGGNITITLPAAGAYSGSDQFIQFNRTDTSSNTVTIQRAGTDVIDFGLTSVTLSGANSKRLMTNDVSRWRTV